MVNIVVMEDNIIKFPGKHTPVKKTSKSLPHTVEKMDEVIGQPVVNKIDFTCPSCYNNLTFRFERIVFKNLQFFCSNCGSGWKVTNPMFSNKPLDQSKAS